MVNERNRSTKSLLLEGLRTARGTQVSGEILAAEFGISRVAVWKAAQGLSAAGYPIRSDGGGYLIEDEDEDDRLYPWEFGNHEGSIKYWDTTTSTMDRGRELAERDAGAGTIAVADSQSAGRGRSGREWDSRSGGLFFTLVLPGGAPMLRYAREGLRAQAALSDAVSETVGIRTELRWPNDLYAENRKIAGVLTELRGDGDRLRWILVGVGVNVNNSGDGSRSISCAEIAGRRLSRRKLLNAFLASRERLAGIEGDARIAAEWNSRAHGIGARVGIGPADHGKTKETEDVRGAGKFAGVDEWGRAVVETETGRIAVEAGDGSLYWNR